MLVLFGLLLACWLKALSDVTRKRSAPLRGSNPWIVWRQSAPVFAVTLRGKLARVLQLG